MKVLLGTILARYLRAVWDSSEVILRGPGVYADGTRPRILAAWHGQHFLAPLIRGPDEPVHALIAHGSFGSVYSHTFSKLGLKVLRGSSGRNFAHKGGYRAFRSMLRALQEGDSVALTVDLPDAARIASGGVIRLARYSQRPIVPIAITTQRKIVLWWRWDKPTLNLPFSKLAAVVGGPINVLGDGPDAYFEEKQRELQNALDHANELATLLVNRPTIA